MKINEQREFLLVLCGKERAREFSSRDYNKYVKQHSIWYANLPGDGSVQGGIRPVYIDQNNKGNMHSGVVTVRPITSSMEKVKKILPMHVVIEPSEYNGLTGRSVLLAEQVRTIPMSRLLFYVGEMEKEYFGKIEKALLIQTGMIDSMKSMIISRVSMLSTLEYIAKCSHDKKSKSIAKDKYIEEYSKLSKFCKEYNLDLECYFTPRYNLGEN